MAGILKVDQITDSSGTTAPEFPNGVVATELVSNTWKNSNGTENYKCRAWVNFSGFGTPAIRASGNVSSVTRNGTGDYTVNFTTPMPDANYAASVESRNSSLGGWGQASNSATKTANNYRFHGARDGSGALIDTDENTVAIFR